jgi:hypothetical protein
LAEEPARQDDGIISGDNRAMRTFLVLVAVAAVIGLAVPAHADPGSADSSFLAALRKAGITYRSDTEAVAAGEAVCELMGAGQPGLDVVKRVTELNPGFTISGAAKFTAIAASAYCPQSLEAGGVAAHERTSIQ